MSTRYQIEPETRGKLKVRTTLGDVDIELWPNEAPHTCKTFLKLCAIKYFDGSSFHRLIPKFLTQTGGPSSSISELTRFMFDKESKQDEKLASLKITSEVLSRKIEVHSRLRFSHPGILAVAENQEKFVHQNQKDSFAVQKQSGEQVEMNYADVIEKNQFFITLGACDWLNNKHTVFGKVVGNSIYNLLKFNDLEMEKVESGEGSEKIASDKALDPPVIREIQIVESPFSEEDFPLTQLRVQHQSLIEEFKEEERKEKERIRKQNQNRNQSRKRTKLNVISFHDGDDEQTGDSENDSGEERLNRSRALEGKQVRQEEPKAVSESSTGEARPKQGQQDPESSKTGAAQKNSTSESVAHAKKLKDEYRAMKAKLKSLRKKNSEAENKKHMTGAANLGKLVVDEIKEASSAEGSVQRYVERRKLFLEAKKGGPSNRIDSFTGQSRKRKKGNRQSDTLKRFEMFKTKLKQAKTDSSVPTDEPVSVEKKKKKEKTNESVASKAFKGGLGDNLTEMQQEQLGKPGENDEDEESWMKAKLTFRRHIDDDFRKNDMEFSLKASDYKVIDTSRVKHL